MLHECLDDNDIGGRLRIARETAGMTQAVAAFHIGVARTTLVAIEKGQRKARLEELQQLARAYNTSVNTILRREAISVDLVPRFRKLQTGKDDAANSAARLLADLVRAEVELENLLGIRRVLDYPPERPLLSGDVCAQAENDAAYLRQWLGLGSSPIRDLVSLVELDLGIRIYLRRLDPQISGLFVYDEALGACILLNANHPKSRRTQTLAHELGHFVTKRRQAEVLHREGPGQSREEQYAELFGRVFLTPARSVMQRFHEITAGSSTLTRRHVILLAHTFQVSREAILWRLEELGLTKPGTRDWFDANGSITDDQARQVLGELFTEVRDANEAERRTALRLNLLVEEAWRRGLLSEGQLAHLLHLDRVELRRILDTMETEGSEPDDRPKLP